MEMAGQPFIWVVKFESWILPEVWSERISKKGLVIRDWVDQRRILSQPAIGGFFTHIGWNSILEGLSTGVPLLSWPINADQKINGKYAANGLGMGVLSMGPINQAAISRGVKMLMVEDEGEKAREKAQELLGNVSRKVVLLMKN
ncbi:hypothetical protein ACFE04_031622 [Oxalis oulophora]